MSKVTNDGLTRSDMHRMLYSCTHMATVGVKGLIQNTRRHEADLDRYILSSQNIFWSYGLHGKGTCRNSYSVTASCRHDVKARWSELAWESDVTARQVPGCQSHDNRQPIVGLCQSPEPRVIPGNPRESRRNDVTTASMGFVTSAPRNWIIEWLVVFRNDSDAVWF